MKTLKNIGLKALLLALSFFASGCVAFVAFEEPQPFFKKSEVRFDKKFQGAYFNPLDSGLLTINDSTILISHFWTVSFPINKIHPIIEVNLAKDHLPIQFGPTLQTTEGHVYQSWIETDTVFALSDQHILRRFKKDYFLNYKELDDYWYLELMSLDKDNKLVITAMFIEDLVALENEIPLKKIRDSNGDVIKVVLQPNKKQFKKMIRREDYRLIVFEAERINLD